MHPLYFKQVKGIFLQFDCSDMRLILKEAHGPKRATRCVCPLQPRPRVPAQPGRLGSFFLAMESLPAGFKVLLAALRSTLSPSGSEELGQKGKKQSGGLFGPLGHEHIFDHSENAFLLTSGQV